MILAQQCRPSVTGLPTDHRLGAGLQSASARSRRRPSATRRKTRSQMAARRRLWVAMIEVRPRSRCISRMQARGACRPCCSSRSPVGSSASSRAGDITSARAMATRCCSPPDSVPGPVVEPVAEPDAPQQRLGPAAAPCASVLARDAQRHLGVLDARRTPAAGGGTGRRSRCAGCGRPRPAGRSSAPRSASPMRIVPASKRSSPPEHVQQRALPHARRADDRHHLPLLDRQVEPAQHGQRAGGGRGRSW